MFGNKPGLIFKKLYLFLIGSDYVTDELSPGKNPRIMFYLYKNLCFLQYHSGMKQKLLLLITMIVWFSGISAQTDNLNDLLATAQAGLAGYLEKIPPGRESLYGFKTRDEFLKAKPGKPYQIFSLSEEFYNDTLLTDQKYMVPTGEWRISVTVNNKPVVMLTVAKMKGVYEVVGIGAAGLANELGDFEKKHSPGNSPGRILRVHPLNCDFVVSSPDNEDKRLKIYPLHSAKMVLDRKCRRNAPYRLPKALSVIKAKVNAGQTL